MRLVVRSSSLVRADVSGVVLDLLAPGDALPLAALVEALLVRSGVLAGVRQTVDAANVHCTLYTSYEHIPREQWCRVNFSCSALPAAKRFFAISKWRMVSNARIFLITVSTKNINLNCDRIFRAKR